MVRIDCCLLQRILLLLLILGVAVIPGNIMLQNSSKHIPTNTNSDPYSIPLDFESPDEYNAPFGYYLTPDSEFAQLEYSLQKYSLTGNTIEAINELTIDLSQYRLVIIPMHNWTLAEYQAISTYVENGGSVFICGNVSNLFVNVSLASFDPGYISLTETYCPEDFVRGFWCSYLYAFKTLFYDGFGNIPLDIVRPLYVITSSNETPL